MWDYERWTTELERHFLQEPAGHPIVLCVDTDTLAIMTSEDGEAAAAALIDCVANEVMPGYRFWRVAMWCRRWALDEMQSAPPSLPLLAVAVLAASRMDRAADVGAHNYYSRFRQLFEPSSNQTGMPGNYGAVVPGLWRELETWLNDHLGGERGILTLPSDAALARNPYRKNIGHALQQALFRASDRRRLEAFFRSVGLEPGEEEIAAGELRRTLALWAGRRLPQAERLHNLATEPEHESYCLRLLQRAAEDWNGLLDDPESGKPVSTMRFCLAKRPPSLSVVLPWDERLPSETAIPWRNEAIRLTSDMSAPYFDPVPLPISISEEVLSRDLTLTGPDICAALEAKPVHALRYDEYLGAWVSTESLEFGELHHLLVRDNEVVALREFARSEGIKIRDVPGLAGLSPPGWTVISDFRILSRPVAEPPGAIAALLRSGGGPRLRLVGGLQVPEFNRAYLTGGAPLLALPEGMATNAITLQRMSTGEELVVRAESSEYPLDKLQLDEGQYLVQFGESSLSFDLVDGLVETAGEGAGSVGTRARTTSMRGLHGYDHGGIHPVTVSTPAEGQQCVLVGPGPHDLEIVEIPMWLSDLAGGGGLSWTATAEWLSFTPVWRLIKTGPDAERYMVTRLGDERPHPVPHGEAWVGLIKRAELAETDADTVELWQRYVDAAEAQS